MQHYAKRRAAPTRAGRRSDEDKLRLRRLAQPLNNLTDLSYHQRQLTFNLPIGKVQNRKTEPLQVTVTTCVCGAARVVPTAVNFYDKFYRRGDEVADKTTTDRNLAAKRDTERAAT
jgi:hypothetical protein